MIKRLRIFAVSLLLFLIALPVNAQSMSALEVLKAVGEADVENYFNFQNDTRFKVVDKETDMTSMFRLTAQLNWSENPQFQMIAEQANDSNQFTPNGGLIIKDNKVYNYATDGTETWNLVSNDASDTLKFIINIANGLKDNVKYSESEMKLITQFTDFNESADQYQFKLKKNIDPQELTDAINETFASYMDELSEDATAPFELTDYTTVEKVKEFLDLEPEISLTFYKDSFLLASIYFYFDNNVVNYEVLSEFTHYGEIQEIDAPEITEETTIIEVDPIIEETEIDVSGIKDKIFSQKNVEVEITRAYLTTERATYTDSHFDNVITIEYILQNNNSESFYPGSELMLYAEDFAAEEIYLPTTKTKKVTPNRKVRLIKSFGFDGEIKNIELELMDPLPFDNNDPTIIPLINGAFKE